MQEDGEPISDGEGRGRGGRPGSGPHIRHLDGLRAIAVYLVVAFHADLHPAKGGFIGVDTFFVLSGFLVTGVLLRDVAHGGRIDLWRFYARRARRLLPAAAVNLVVTALVFSAVASPAEVGDATASMRSAALYVSNWWFIGESTDYFGSAIEASPVLHYWSLSVEEQYYLLWPLLLGGLLTVTGARRGGRTRRAALVVAGVGLASAAAALWVARTNLPRAYYGTDTRAYQLLAGAALALAPGALARLHRVRGARRSLPVASVAAFAALVAAATPAVDLAPVGRGILATAAVVVLIASLDAGGPVRWLLSTPAAVYLGRISYGTYLWHWPIVVVARREADLSDPSMFLLSATLASGLGALSAQLLERPVRVSPLLDRASRPVVVAGVALSLLVGLVAVPRALDEVGTAAVAEATATAGTPVPASVVATLAEESDPTAGCDLDDVEPCPVHDGSGPRVLVLGDSHAAMLAPAMAEVGRRLDLAVTGIFMRACPWVRDLQRLWIDPDHCYDMQAAALDELVPELDPDVVVLVHAAFDDPVLPRTILVRGRGRLDPGPAREPLVEERVRAAVSELRDAGRRVVLVEPVPVSPEQEPSCLSGADHVEDCRVVSTVGPTHEEDLFRRLDADDDEIWSLDLDRQVCPYLPICDPIVRGQPVWVDSSHLSAAFSRELADPIEGFLVGNGVIPG